MLISRLMAGWKAACRAATRGIQRQRNPVFSRGPGQRERHVPHGQRLTPYLPQSVARKDELQIGRIRLQVGIN